MVDVGRKVFRTEGEALIKLASLLDSSFDKAVELLLQTKGRVVITGVGKSGLIGQKIAATLNSTGTPSLFMHAAEAVHGELGTVLPEDTVVALSYSGETAEIRTLLEYIKRNGNPLISLTGEVSSTLARYSDVVLSVHIDSEACPTGLVPTTSTTATLAMGDALAVALMVKRGFSRDDFAYFHPGGKIGKSVLKVKHLMHKGNELPLVHEEDSMAFVVKTISEKGFGVALVLSPQERVIGIITDGDLRRCILQKGDLSSTKAVCCMHPSLCSIDGEELAVRALQKMEEKKITSLFIPGPDGSALGLVHLHDLWRTQMI